MKKHFPQHVLINKISLKLTTDFDSMSFSLLKWANLWQCINALKISLTNHHSSIGHHHQNEIRKENKQGRK